MSGGGRADRKVTTLAYWERYRRPPASILVNPAAISSYIDNPHHPIKTFKTYTVYLSAASPNISTLVGELCHSVIVLISVLGELPSRQPFSA